jgi:hypothetical protein
LQGLADFPIKRIRTHAQRLAGPKLASRRNLALKSTVVAPPETFEALYRMLDAISAKILRVGTIWQLGGKRRRIFGRTLNERQGAARDY